MARPKRSAAKKAVTKTTNTQTSTTKETSTSIVPRVPRQLPLKPLNSLHAAKKAEKEAAQVEDEVFIQFGGKEISHNDVLARVREAYKNTEATDTITSLKVYVKPEESKIYYVINGDITGSIDY